MELKIVADDLSNFCCLYTCPLGMIIFQVNNFCCLYTCPLGMIIFQANNFQANNFKLSYFIYFGCFAG